MNGLHKVLLFHLLAQLGPNVLGSKIIFGETAQEDSLLYMASVQNSGGHICGGFLISKDFVLTAAHCDVPNRAPTRVVLGSHNLKKPYQIVRGIDRKCKHPFFMHVGYGYDIMLLKLSSEVQLGKEVQTVQLPPYEMNIKEGLKCRVAGWGKNSTWGTVVDDLKFVDVSVIQPQVCKQEWLFLPNNVICAGGYGTTKGFCQGDSGGPLVCNGVAVGIVSFNKLANCDYPNAPNVYTDIRKHMTWIMKVLQENTCDM